MPVKLPVKPLWLLFRVLGQPNTMQTMFYTLPLFTSLFTSWLTGAFDICGASRLEMLSTKDCHNCLWDQILIRYYDSAKSQVLLARAVCPVSKPKASILCRCEKYSGPVWTEVAQNFNNAAIFGVLCVNGSPIWYVFVAGTRAIRYSVDKQQGWGGHKVVSLQYHWSYDNEKYRASKCSCFAVRIVNHNAILCNRALCLAKPHYRIRHLWIVDFFKKKKSWWNHPCWLISYSN